MKKLKTEINLLLEKEELSNRIRIIDEEKIAKLKETSDIPNGIDMYGMDYYEFERAEFSDSELDAYIKLRYLKSIDTIKKCCIFFVILAAIGGIVSMIFGINLISTFSKMSYLIK